MISWVVILRVSQNIHVKGKMNNLCQLEYMKPNIMRGRIFTLNHLDTRKLTWYGREEKRVIDSEMQIIEE